MTHTTFTQSNLSVSSAIVKPFFSSMSERAEESFAASVKRTKKQFIAHQCLQGQFNNNNADMDYHAVLP